MMLDLAFLLGLTAWAAGVGLWALRRFGPLPDHPADALALALPLGLGALALGVFGLGEVGLLSTRGIEALVALGTPFALLGSTAWLRPAARNRSLDTEGEGDARPGRVDRAVAILLGVTLLATLITALAPVTDGDALCYHLLVPRRFLERGSLGFDPDLHETVYPLLTELLYAVALALRGPVACRLVQWSFGVVFALTVAALARPVLGRRASWAAAVALLVPAVSNGMSAPLNDVALAAMGSSALFAWIRFRDRPTLCAALLNGVLCGLTMGVKYPGLVLTGLIGMATGAGFLGRSILGVGGLSLGTRATRRALTGFLDRWAGHDDPTRRGRWIHGVAFAMAALLVGGCWHARAFWHTGNPVHPFFRATFGGAGLDEVLGPEKRPLAVTAWNLVTALGPLTLRPDTFDSFAHQFGPVFLLFLPAIVLERPPRRLLTLGAVGYAFLALCLTQRQSMRFVLTALGPLAVLVAWQASVWVERSAKSRAARVLAALWVAVLCFEASLAVARARHGASVIVGMESAEHYLARKEPTFEVGRWVDANLPPEARIVGQDHRGFYIPRPYTMELAHRRRTGLASEGKSPESIVATLRRAGFTHLLLCPPEPLMAVEFDPTLSSVLAPWLEARNPLYEADLADGDGIVRHYAIFDLAAPRSATLASHDREEMPRRR